MPICKLPTLLVNQIAAGEVIERPASVVKELVENSIDAGATQIDVTVDRGGSELIRVTDNGSGIAPEELVLAVSPHATSKLTSHDALNQIGTLGFRGEALASIASVSRLRITSRATTDGRPAEAAAVLEASGEHVSEVEPAAAAPGTTVEVHDLFFNTPARRKFLKTDSTEFSHINEMMTRIVMVHPETGFRLTHNGRQVFELLPGESRSQRCVALLGKDLEEGLLEFADDGEIPLSPPGSDAIVLWGLAGLPSLARNTGKYQYLCVNGRPIRDRNLQHAVKEAYRGLIPPDKYPMIVLFIDVNASEVDVNVHPTKAEVRFRNPGHIHGKVLTVLRQRLLGSDLTPNMSLGMGRPAATIWSGTSEISSDPADRPVGTDGDDSDGPSSEHTGQLPPFSPRYEPFPPPGRQQPSFTTAGQANTASNVGTTGISSKTFVDYFRHMDPKQKGFVYEEVKRAVVEAGLDQNNTATDSVSINEHHEPQSTVKPLKILQVHNSYVVTEDDQGLLIVDQHALHERVMFEELRRRVLGEERNLESQRLLMPEVLDADGGQQAILDRLKPLLTKIGIEIEPIGPNAVAIQSFPTFLFDKKIEPCAFLRDLLDEADEGRLDVSNPNAAEAALHDILDMMSCKAAVKAGERMTDSELAILLAKRHDVERSSNCPHGRPTTLRLTMKDLARQFKRT